MDKYYYFVAQLPMLTLDSEDIPSLESFVEEAQKWMSDKDLRVIKSVDINAYTDNEKHKNAFDKFCELELAIRSDLAKYRQSQKENFEYKTQVFPLSYIKEGNPLEVEKRLLEFRWNFIDELEAGHNFDLDFLVTYYLKLQILWRIKSFDKQLGKESFDEVCVLETSEDKK